MSLSDMAYHEREARGEPRTDKELIAAQDHELAEQREEIERLKDYAEGLKLGASIVREERAFFKRLSDTYLIDRDRYKAMATFYRRGFDHLPTPEEWDEMVAAEEAVSPNGESEVRDE